MKARAARENSGPAVGPRAPAGKSRPVQAKARRPVPDEAGTQTREVLESKDAPQAAFGDIRVLPAQHASGAGQGGSSLPGPLRRKMESAFGADFSNVRVHQGPAAEALSALAFTQGRDLHFAPGRYNPATPQGQRIIAHELAHVVQQRQGRVARPSSGGVPLNADPSLEAEADALGGRAARGEAVRGAVAHGGTATRQDGSGVAPIQGLLSRALLGAGGMYGGFVARNLYQQRRAFDNEDSVDHSTRLGAMLASNSFPSGTVGYGAHGGIRAVHALMGGIGQSDIGNLFRGEEAQRVMGEPIDSPANLELGQMEHQYWQNRYEGHGAHGASTTGERFGGFAGSSFSPETRAQLQEGFSRLRDQEPPGPEEWYERDRPF